MVRRLVRIVSLCPSLTELVFDLGRGAELVGVTRFCIHPEQELADIEKIGGTKNPDVARIIALAPDVVFMNEEENRLEDAEALRAAGVRCHVTFPLDVADTAAMVRSIGAELGRVVEAESIALDIERRAERVRRSARAKREVSFAYLIWRKPWMAAGRDTFPHAILTLPGARNVFDSLPRRYPEIDAATLARIAPDAVLLGTEPFPFAPKHAGELARQTGLEPERFRIVDGEYLSWHGSRTPRGIDYAERVIEEIRETK